MGRRKLSDYEKGVIDGLKAEGVPSASIAIQVGCSVRAVNKYLARVRSRDGDTRTRFSPGRPRKTTPREDRMLVRMVTGNRTVSTKEIREELAFQQPISTRSIRRRIVEAGFKGGWANKKPLISHKNRKKRVEFAKAHLHWTPADWAKVIWSDESPYTVRGSTRHRVWRRPNERYTPNCVVTTLKHVPKINVWGCFCAHGVGSLHRINGIMDQKVYKQILVRQLRPSIKKLFPAKNSEWIFQQDNDPKHTAHSVRKYLESKGYTILQWPAQSPDLNPIENLWAIIEYRLRYRICSSPEALFELLKTEWEKLEPELLQNLVNSMPRRLQAVIDAKGFATKY